MPSKVSKLRTTRNIPSAISLGKEIWDVQLVRGMSKREGCVGDCDYEDRLITLDADQPQDELEETFAHEILHAIFPPKIVGVKTEEKIVRGMERQFLQVLRSGVLFKLKGK